MKNLPKRLKREKEFDHEAKQNEACWRNFEYEKFMSLIMLLCQLTGKKFSFYLHVSCFCFHHKSLISIKIQFAKRFEHNWGGRWIA
jgi:hypothetical protein